MAFVRNPVVYVPDLTNGRPIVDGKVYLLTAGTVPPTHDSAINPATLLTVTYVNEAGNTVEQPQPLYTSKGGCLYGSFPEEARQYMIAPQEYVFAAYDKIGRLQYSAETTASDYVEVDALAAADSTVLVGGVEAKEIGRKLDYVIDVRDYGAVGDGLNDDTAAINAAIAAAKAKRVMFNNSVNGGNAAIYFPAGLYRVTSTINLVSVIGLKIFGDGARATSIWLDANNTSLFYMRIYIQCSFDDIGFITGAINRDAAPRLDILATGSRNNIAFNFDGDGGGTMLNFTRCRFMNWSIALNSKPAVNVNIDGHKYDFCQFFYNNNVWDNTNSQAVIWSFTNCQVFYTNGTVFKNPGSSLLVSGGDYINPGTFLEATLSNVGQDSQFQDLRFETYQNLDPTSAPKWLVLSGTHTGLRFVNISCRGGGSLGSKVSVDIQGNFDVTFETCISMGGQWNVAANTSVSGVLSNLTFINCSGTGDNIVQTLSGGQGNRPINIAYENNIIGSTAKINRSFIGATASQSQPMRRMEMIDQIRFQSAINATTVSKSMPIFCIAPYNLVVAEFELGITKNGAASVDIIVWADSTKTTKICEVLGYAPQNSYRVYRLRNTDILNFPAFTSTSNPLFIEFISAGNAGTVTAEIAVTLSQRA